jgi:hypothetical protein
MVSVKRSEETYVESQQDTTTSLESPRTLISERPLHPRTSTDLTDLGIPIFILIRRRYQ